MKKFILAILTIFILFSVSCSEINHENIDETDIDDTQTVEIIPDDTPIIQLDIMEDFIVEAYDNFFISVNAGRTEIYSMYQNGITFFDDVDERYILTVLYFNNPYLKSIRFNFDEFETRYIEGVNPDDYSEFDKKYFLQGHILPIEIFDNVLHEFYGTEIIYNYCSYSPFDGLYLDYEGSNYYIPPNTGGGEFFENIEQNYLLSAESQGDYLYLYDKYAKVTYISDNYQGTRIMYFSIFADSKCEILLKGLTGEESLAFRELIGYYINSDKHSQSFYDDFGDIMQPYKHTFKKAEDGSYYWISTEMISEIP